MKHNPPLTSRQTHAHAITTQVGVGRLLCPAAFALALFGTSTAFAEEAAQVVSTPDAAPTNQATLSNTNETQTRQATLSKTAPAGATPEGGRLQDEHVNEKAELRPFPFNLALVSPVELLPGAAKRRILFELGALYGRVGASAGMRVDGLASTVHQDSLGFGTAGLWSSVGGNSVGFATSGLGSWVAGDATGFQVAGAFQGTAGHVTGFQVGGLVNYSGESEGVATAGLFNWTDGAARGAQVAGLVNRAGDVSGAQVAGLVNRAQEVTGVQIGVVNIGGNVSGTQVGVVNVAKKLDGAQVGVVNVSDNARYQATTWVDERLTLNAGLRSLWKPMYGFLAVGIDPQGFDTGNLAREEYSVSYGVGGRIPLPIDILFLEADLMHTVDFSLEDRGENGNLLRQRLALVVQPLPWLALVVGGGLKQHWHQELDEGFELGPTLFAGAQLW